MKAVVVLGIFIAIYAISGTTVFCSDVAEDLLAYEPARPILDRRPPTILVKRGACDPDTCDSNCRYCFNGKCDCNHH